MTMGPPQAEEALREASRSEPIGRSISPIACSRSRTRSGPRARSRWRSRRKAPISSSAGARRSIRRPGRCRPRWPRSSVGRTSRTWRPSSARRHAPAHAPDGLRRGGVRGRPLPLVVSVGRPPAQATSGRRRRPDRGLAGDRPRRRGLRVRQALRTDRIADARARRPRLAARACRDQRRERRRGGREDPRAARGAGAGATELGEARSHRRGAGHELRLLERLRARRRPAAAGLARADRPEPSARGEARRARRRTADRPRARRAPPARRRCTAQRWSTLADDPALAEYHPELWAAGPPQVLARPLAARPPRPGDRPRAATTARARRANWSSA